MLAGDYELLVNEYLRRAKEAHGRALYDAAQSNAQIAQVYATMVLSKQLEASQK